MINYVIPVLAWTSISYTVALTSHVIHLLGINKKQTSFLTDRSSEGKQIVVFPGHEMHFSTQCHPQRSGQ